MMNADCDIAQKLWTCCTKDWENAKIYAMHLSFRNMYQNLSKLQSWMLWKAKMKEECNISILSWFRFLKAWFETQVIPQ